MSHELRTPLTVICGYLETLLDNVEEVNPRWTRALQQMQQQGGRMQIDVGVGAEQAQWRQQIGLLARLQRANGLRQHLVVELEADFHHVAALVLAEHLAGAHLDRAAGAVASQCYF